jgi:putative hydrolase of the HAD superfamily
MLILDLDNTIFETKSIKPEIFKPILDVIEEYYHSINEYSIGQQLFQEFWSVPMDKVFAKYNTPKKIRDQAFDKFNKIDFHLKIKTYGDYDVLKSIQKEKILVTTGYEKLQIAKIKALNIKKDFKEIFIDNPISENRKYKLGIFKEILQKENLQPKEVWVLGDSADNEIKAGKELGMNTIQRLNNGDTKSNLSDYGISSFHELHKIIK